MINNRDEKGRIVKSFTEEMTTWLKDNFLKYPSTRYLTPAFNKQFNTNKTRASINSYCNRLGLIRENWKNPTKQKYTHEMKQWMINHFNKYNSLNELKIAFNKEFGMNQTTKAILYLQRTLGLKYTKEHRKEKVLEQKKKYLEEHRKKYPYGSEIKKGNNTYIRMPNHKYISKAQYVYQQHKGKLPKNSVIVFLDGNNNNFDINNLKALKRNVYSSVVFYMINGEKDFNEKVIEAINLEKEIKEVMK